MEQEVQTAVEIVQTLTSKELKEFEKLEHTVSISHDAMLIAAEKIGEALSEIEDKKYFTKLRPNSDQPIFSSFDDYFRWRFNRGKTTRFNYQKVFKIMNILRDQNIDPTPLSTMGNALEFHDDVRQIVQVSGVDKKDVDAITRQVARGAWDVIINSAPEDEHGEKLITQEHLKISFDVIQETLKSGLVEIDGEQVPISLTAIAMQENITNELYEQIQRRRQQNYELLESTRARRLEPKKLPHSHIFQEPTADVLFSVVCPKHGKTKPRSLVQAGFWTDCRCLAIMEAINETQFEFLWKEGRNEFE